jgi:hypothetical protein
MTVSALERTVMPLKGLAIWKQAVRFHFSHWKRLLPVFPLLFFPVVSDALHSLLIRQKVHRKDLLPGQAARDVWSLLPSLLAMKLYFEGTALLWTLVPIYGIIQGVRHRLRWAMASNVLVFEGLSGKAGCRRCREIVQDLPAGIGVRTLITLPSLLFTGILLAWLIGGSLFNPFYAYGFWGFMVAIFWIAIPGLGAVNTFLYLATHKDNEPDRVVTEQEKGQGADFWSMVYPTP